VSWNGGWLTKRHIILLIIDVEKLELVCVPGHKGININEKTDLIAKSAVNEGKPIDSKLDVKDALREIKKLLELE